ncbi:GMC family oxidoreductase [Arcobacter sp. F2176]|uniref:GMC family oxidoreductase n=1 Tax=Arcobacter sp. F2176 TaxID=2044511 RepID=UPI00215A0169|nr:GMC family oxidoreductase [Arcobacter sp. F2176]
MEQKLIYDVCIIGSGAGAGPIAYTLAKEGKKVLILEKGDIYTEKDFSKDEIAYSRRDIFTPNLKDEYHVIEEKIDGKWYKFPTYETGWSFWNGNILGGSSNFMSGYFHRLKPKDFKLKSTFGKYKGANVVDWPISYDELEPYYDMVEKVIGVSGEYTKYEHAEPRSSKNYAYPRLKEHPIVDLIDKACEKLDYVSYKVPRAIISQNKDKRNACYYSNYCGSYNCSSGAKGSSRASLIQPILNNTDITIIPNAFVFKLLTNKNKKIEKAVYYTKEKIEKTVEAKLFVVATQAVESSRLLLNSKNSDFPNGLANSSGQVGKNMLFTGGGQGSAIIDTKILKKDKLFETGFFVNRGLQDWYFTKEFKGGTIDFLFDHANPIRKALRLKSDDNGNLLFGEELQDKIYKNFTKSRILNFEVFTDWMPNDNCFVSIDEKYKDKYGVPVATIRIGAHPQDVKVGNFLAQKAIVVLKQMGASDIKSDISPLPSANLQAGGCRFGNDPKKSVLNKYCQSHDIENLFVTDGSFMPTGGSVPYTWTIYANSFRVADYIKKSKLI